MSDLGDLIRLDRHRERIELDSNAAPMRREKPVVYVIAALKRTAQDWVWRNKRDHDLKWGHPDSPMAAKGLYLKDVPVYVLDPPTREVRDAWITTGARLVYL